MLKCLNRQDAGATWYGRPRPYSLVTHEAVRLPEHEHENFSTNENPREIARC